MGRIFDENMFLYFLYGQYHANQAWYWLKVFCLIDVFPDTAGTADAYGNEFHVI